MDHQDWKPVIFKGKPKKPVTKKLLGSGPRNPSRSQVGYREDEDGKPIKKTLPKDFGKKMQQARAKKGWTQKDLAQKMNCKVSEIQDYEHNRVDNPNKSFARRIERTLGSKLF